jgi:transposase
VSLRANEKMPVSFIARVTGLSESHIHKLHSMCKKHGVSSLQKAARGGRRRSYLTIAEEKEMLSQIEEQAVKGGVVEVTKIHKMFEEKVGIRIAKYTAYRLLHRHGWRKITPRPYHPK